MTLYFKTHKEVAEHLGIDPSVLTRNMQKGLLPQVNNLRTEIQKELKEFDKNKLKERKLIMQRLWVIEE